MKRIVLVVIAVMASGCRTPYQRTMGFMGGVEATPIGNGAYVIHSSVNGYTSQGTAYEYAYRRAGEVCPAGYQLADSATSSTSSYMRNGYGGVQEVKKPEVTLVVQCNRPAPAPAPSPAPPPQEGYARWWCVTFASGRLGSCYHDRGACETRRTAASATDATTSFCDPQRIAVCFGIAFPSQPGSDEMCHPNLTACTDQRAYVLANPSQATALTECRLID